MSFSNNKVSDFLERLSAQCPKTRDESQIKSKNLDKVYLNFKGNFGRYQIFPMDNVVTDYPFVTLFNTYEVNVQRRQVAQDGTESVHDAWLRLLPPDYGYVMRDMTGRVVSSLTASDLELIKQTRALFDELWEEIDGRTNREDWATKLLRKRNYTLFNAYVINFWNNDSRTPTRQNFPALFVCTAKQFVKVVQDNINDKSLMNDGDVSWISDVYNRNLSGRDGFLMFSIAADPARPGYIVTANHEWGRAKQLEAIVIPEEDAALMVDPIETFLGWQAPKNLDNTPAINRRLFNPDVYKEAQEFLANQIAAVRMAKSLGTDPAEAIATTTAKALAAQPSNGFKAGSTNDPVLAAQQASATQTYESPNTGANAERIEANNTAPFTSPAASTIDPITGMPVGAEPQPSSNPFNGGGSNPFAGNSGGFGKPNFGGGSPFNGAPFGN